MCGRAMGVTGILCVCLAVDGRGPEELRGDPQGHRRHHGQSSASQPLHPTAITPLPSPTHSCRTDDGAQTCRVRPPTAASAEPGCGAAGVLVVGGPW